jgi:mono/diheme cytochrome c family protein
MGHGAGGRAALTLLPAALVAVLGACSMFESEASRGRAIADRWCAECHRVAVDQPSGTRVGHILPAQVEAPSFMEIAARHDVSAEYLRHFMGELHLPMPIYRLSAEEQDSVIHYILTLQTPTS